MKTSSSIAAFFLILATVSFAQKAATPADPKNGTAAQTADEKWANLAGVNPTATSKTPTGITKDNAGQQKTQISTQADKSRQTAQDAKSFYTQYPTNPNAEAARKIEVIAQLHGIKDGDQAHQKTAQDLAAAFRRDTSHPVSARTEVALAADRVSLSLKIKNKTVVDRPSEKEKLADGIRAEFGDTPELHSYYVEVARSADMFTANHIANNLLKWSSDRNIRAEAQAIVDRNALIGQKLNLKLASAEAGIIDLNQPNGAVTVLYAWSPSGGQGMLKALTNYQNSIPPGVQFVYLALGGSAKDATTLSAQAPIKGRFCYQPGSTISPTLNYLKLKTLPYVLVLNREGKLVGFGPPAELMGLLSLAR